MVRIVTGQTTSGTYSFTNVNAPGGSLRLTIVNNLQNPLSVKIFGGNPYLSAGNTQALTAGVSNFTGDVVYTWYVNGALAGTGASYRFGASRPLGFYRIDATAFSVTGGRSGSATMNVRVVGSIPAVSSTFPADGASGVALNTIVTAKFNGVMDASTITTATFTLKLGSSPVAGSVSYTGTTATFTPAAPLSGTAVYTASLSGEIRDQAGVPLVTQRSWTFTTLTPPLGPPAVAMGTAGNFAVLARTGITIGAAGRVTGNVGLSASGAAGLVFASTQDASRTFSTSSLVSGRIYSTDDIAPTPGLLLTAAADERSAYGDARGRGPANFTNRGAGELGGLTFAPALYRWTTAATITTDITLQGGPNDIWIFQVDGALSVAAAIAVHLTGGADPRHVFWQSGGAVALGAGARLSGFVLANGAISAGAGAGGDREACTPRRR